MPAHEIPAFAGMTGQDKSLDLVIPAQAGIFPGWARAPRRCGDDSRLLARKKAPKAPGATGALKTLPAAGILR